jgi:hypothetical protein
MIFRIRQIQKQFDTVHNFGLENLIVSGCSFTYNNHETAAVNWPYYLRDLGGFEQVLDCSLPGAGNSHISNSLIWGLEIDQPDPDNSLIAVMWSGNDRDDYICPASNIRRFPYQFNYTDNVRSGITGGNSVSSIGNTLSNFKEFSMTKTLESRAIENYLHIAKTYQYLKAHGYKFIFLNFCNASIPSRSQHFDIHPYLPKSAQHTLNKMFAPTIDLHHYALKNDLLSQDDFHPNPDGQLGWTKQMLIPYLISQFT